ncbi:hypothetical protein SBV1_2980019 [Verrucomicrobia bacterium]|nr:hypothetical protein SBV1_2980019 [Verrucomicrobiota bacterium]
MGRPTFGSGGFSKKRKKLQIFEIYRNISTFLFLEILSKFFSFETRVEIYRNLSKYFELLPNVRPCRRKRRKRRGGGDSF